MTALQGHFKTPLGAAQTHGADGQAPPVQGLHHLMKALPLRTQQVFFGNPAVLKV